jgi:hypothetical protein
MLNLRSSDIHLFGVKPLKTVQGNVVMPRSMRHWHYVGVYVTP